MAKITNNTRDTLSFNVRGDARDGVPPTDSVEPGQTKDIDVDMESGQVRGRILAGAISVSGRAAAKAEKIAEGKV